MDCVLLSVAARYISIQSVMLLIQPHDFLPSSWFRTKSFQAVVPHDVTIILQLLVFVLGSEFLDTDEFLRASALLAIIADAVVARTVRPSHSGVLSRPMKIWSCIRQENYCSLRWRKVFQDIRRGSPSGHSEGVKVKHVPLSLAKIWPIIGHNLETVQDRW